MWSIMFKAFRVAFSFEHSARLPMAINFPGLEYDPATIASCVAWFDNSGDESCEEVRDTFGISAENFHEWNPSVGVDCKGWRFQSYCVLTKDLLRSATTTTSTSTEAPTRTSTTSTLGPSPTLWEALGCYLDDTEPSTLDVLISKDGGDTDLTVSKCQDACYLASPKYYGGLFVGVEEGNQCWCSDFVGNEQAEDSTDCNLRCSGNKTETCGGKGRINVFEAIY